MIVVSIRAIINVVLIAIVATIFTIFVLHDKVIVTSNNQQLIFIICVLAAIADIAAKPLPVVGHFSAGGLLYFFALFSLGEAHAVFITMSAVVTSVLVRTILRGTGAVLYNIVYAAYTTLLIGGLGILLKLWLPLYGVLSVDSFKGLLIVILPFILLDFLFSSIGASQFLDHEMMRDWAHAKNRTWAFTALYPILGYVGALFYSVSGNKLFALGILAAVVCLLHISFPPFVEEKTGRESVTDLVTEMDKAKEKTKQYERQSEMYRKKLARKEEELLALMDFGRAWGTDLSMDNAMRVIFDMLRKLFRYQTCIIFSSASLGEESYFVTKKYSSPYGEYCKNLYIKYGETIVGKGAQEKKSLLIGDAKQSDSAHRLLEYEKSEMAVPLVIQDKVLWVLYIGQKEEKIYTQEDLQLFTLLAYQAALFLVYAESYEATVSLATTDGLTGLYTHRYFQERLLDEVKRAERYRLPLSLVMIDVDHFKAYNDAYGHPKGDTLLKDISQILRYYTRETDVDCRYAGDEFSLILIETSKANAVMIAERIRDAIVQRLNPEGAQVRITGSFGVASIPEDAKDKAELIIRADDALYNAKKERNKVVAFVSGMSETAHSDKDKETGKHNPSGLEIRILRKDSERKK